MDVTFYEYPINKWIHGWKQISILFLEENEMNEIVKKMPSTKAALIGHFGNNNHQLNLQFDLYSFFPRHFSLFKYSHSNKGFITFLNINTYSILTW